MSNSTKDTKEKILSVAGKLFASNGYDNTSIRDISKEAGVNLASINYHFKNKLNLYKEVMHVSMLALEEKIEATIDKSTDLKDFYWNLFQLLRSENEAFSNGFKLFVANTLPV
ncbi:TetR/AcrR family transcriptional regulator, partial [Bacteriovorax sp. DB6_IX]|uniref:TetR/AcrR family transcriptional regulator n=1 Tax=Bacteriovorax sp. DB6_IX TaxID=1353530 RepID=UPI00055544EA